MRSPLLQPAWARWDRVLLYLTNRAASLFFQCLGTNRSRACRLDMLALLLPGGARYLAARLWPALGSLTQHASAQLWQEG